MDAVNWIDVVIVVLIVLSAIVGLVRGFVREAFSLATWVAAIVLSVLYFKQLAQMMPFDVGNETAQQVLSFTLIFLGVLLVGSLINYLINRATKAVGLGGIDRVLGGAFGVLRGALLVTLLVLLLGLAITGLTEYDVWKQSKLIPKFEEVAEWIKKETPEEALNLASKFATMIGISDATEVKKGAE